MLRGAIYSKLSTEKWPRVDKLVKRLEVCIQSDLWSQHEQQLAEADAATRTAEAQREAAAAAAERAQLEEEQVLVARRQLEAKEVIDRADLLSVLVQQDLTDGDIRSILFDVVIAGSDTTASTATAPLYVLHDPMNAKWLEKAREVSI